MSSFKERTKTITLKALRPFQAALDAVLSPKDRYKGLKTRLFLIIGTLAGIPLTLVIMLSFLWLQNVLKEDFNNQLRASMETSRQSMDFFVAERLSALRFLTQVYTARQLSDERVLTDVFVKFKNEFGELVDLGVIDRRGIQVSYAGPYSLEGKDYSSQDWFHEVAVRGFFVSDVFMGYRRIPHFAIAVRQDGPGKRDFWVLRATIDVVTLNRLITAIPLKAEDDAFIINHKGLLQTPSRFHGNILERATVDIPPPQRDVALTEIREGMGTPYILGYANIQNTPWTFAVIVKSAARSKLLHLFLNDLGVIYLAVALVIAGIIVNLRISTTVVRWIEEAERKREEAIAETEHAGKLASIGRLAAGVAHEINNPLAVINEKAGLMKDLIQASEGMPNKEKYLGILKGIADNVGRCRTITHRLLGFARRMDVKHEDIDVNETIREVIEFLDKEVLYRSIRLETLLSNQLPRITSDKGQLQQVFLNVLNNAIDAVSDGGRITVTTAMAGGNHIRIFIRDDGYGIPREKLKHIFEPFYTTKKEGKGTGLGLSISYGIVQRLGGSITVESEPGKGTCFTIEIPVQTPHG